MNTQQLLQESERSRLALLSILEDQKRTEENLRSSEAYNRLLFNSSPIGLALCKMDGSMVDVNFAYVNILGRTIEETLKLSYWDITPKKYADQEGQQLKSLDETGRYGPYEKEYIHKDGHLVPVRLNGLIFEREGERFIWSSVEDITASKLAEERQASLSRILEESLNEIYVFSFEDLKFIEVNKGVRNNTGYSIEELRKMTPLDLKPEFTPKSFNELISPLRTGEREQIVFETIHRRKNGSIYNVEIRLQCATYEAKSVFVAIILDITGRKRAEEALRISEQKNTALINAIPDMIFVLNREGIFLDFHSPKMESLYTRPESFIGKNIRDILPISVISSYTLALELAIQTGQNQFFQYSLDIADKHSYYEGHLVVYHRNNILVVVRDITERKRAEEELRAKTEELNKFFDTSLDLLCIADTDGYFHKLNPEWEKTLGYNLQELEGKKFLDFIHPDDLEGTLANISDLSSQKEVVDFVNRYRCKDGTYRWIEWRSTPVGKLIFAAARDITDRKHAEEALHEKEHLLSESQRIAHIGGWAWDFSGPIKWTDETYRIYGVSPITFTPSTESLVNLIHPEDRSAMQQWIADCADGKSPSELVFRTILPDGSIRFLNGRGELIYDHGNKPILMSGTVQDITGRKHVEEALRLSEANYRTLIESAADGIFVTDTRGRVLDVNLLSCRLLNYTREEILGLSIPDIVLDEEVARVALELGRLKAGEVVRSEWQFRRKDGTLFPGEVSGTTLPDGRHLGILRDITERKRAEDALRQTKEMMEKIIMTVPGAVSSFHQHTDGSISFPFVSPRFEEFYNISAERLAADASAIFSLIHPDDVGGMQETIAESARTMEPWHYEWRVNNPVLGEIWLEGNSMPIKETDGSIVWHGVVSDITGRKRAEAVLIEKERLISAIAETTPAIIYVYDMVTNSNVYINTGMERLLGYTSKEIHDMGEKVLAILLHPDDLPKIIELSSKILAASDNELFSVEYRMKHRDSNWVNLQSEESVFLRDRNGAVLQKIGVAIDITGRKRIEDILKARNTILEFSFHSTLGQLLQKTLDEIEILTESKIAFFHFVEEDQITLSLQTWSTNTLQKMCTAEGKNSHYPIDQAGVWVDCVHSRSAVIHNDYSSLPHKKGLPDGHAPVTRELVVPILRNEKIVAILGVGNKESNYDETDIQTITKVADLVWDITVSKRAEETLRISEERLRLSTELANVAVWEFDFNTNSMSRSKNHDSLYGLEWQSKWEFETFLNATHPDDREYSNQIIQNSAAAGGPDNYKFDFRAVHPDKSIHWLEVTGQVVERNPEGRGVIVRGTLIDITERKKIEEERRNLTYRLIVSEEQMRKIAARQLHDEVGQNLTALSINLNYLQSQLSEESKLRMEKRLADSLSILEETIEQIRNIMVELRPAVLDDYGLNSAFSLSLNKFAENTNLNVVYNGNDLAGRLPVNIEFALFRVFQETIHNISKHAKAKNVWVTLEEKNELVKITVQDDGIGFDINRVAASKVNRGLGLLSMAERIKFIGGNLEISSTPGKGTIITVTIKR